MWKQAYTSMRICLPLEEQIDCLIPLAQMYLTEGVEHASKRCVMFDSGFKYGGFVGTFGTRWLRTDLIKWKNKQGSTNLRFTG